MSYDCKIGIWHEISKCRCWWICSLYSLLCEDGKISDIFHLSVYRSSLPAIPSWVSCFCSPCYTRSLASLVWHSPLISLAADRSVGLPPADNYPPPAPSSPWASYHHEHSLATAVSARSCSIVNIHSKTPGHHFIYNMEFPCIMNRNYMGHCGCSTL
jgi:hypothetical protein